MRINVRALGLALGILWALGVFFMAIAAMVIPGNWGDLVVGLLGNVYVGYDASVVGALLGFLWGFVDGFVGGALIAWLYNALAGH